MAEIKLNNDGSRVKRKRIRWSRVFGTLAIAVIVISLVVTLVGKGIDALLSPSFEDHKTSEKIDTLTVLYSKEGSEFIVNTKWRDSDVQDAIHKMTHQKIKAEGDQKWGAIEITKERVETLSIIIEDKKHILDHYETYRSILDKWMDGDFNSVDKDHNTIWNLQNGNVGKATGILSPEQEQKYIDRVFK